jgi:hypothetical protein
VADALCLLLLFRDSPDNSLCDWNVDGRVEKWDIVMLIRELINAGRGVAGGLMRITSLAADNASAYTEAELARLEAEGKDAL